MGQHARGNLSKEVEPRALPSQPEIFLSETIGLSEHDGEEAMVNREQVEDKREQTQNLEEDATGPPSPYIAQLIERYHMLRERRLELEEKVRITMQDLYAELENTINETSQALQESYHTQFLQIDHKMEEVENQLKQQHELESKLRAMSSYVGSITEHTMTLCDSMTDSDHSPTTGLVSQGH